MGYFDKVWVRLDTQNRKMVTWTMHSGRKLSNALDFYVDKARSGGPWVNIGGPLTNTCAYVDTVKWDWALEKNTFYRVRFQVGTEWQYSVPAQAYGSWTRLDYTRAREICRKEYLVSSKVGKKGLLLKRREWGQPCRRCADVDTNEPADAQCTTCFGTGIEAGYYAAIPLPAQLEGVDGGGVDTTKKLTEEIGWQQPIMRKARIVAYPLIGSGDIWIDIDANERFLINQAKTAAEIKGIPLIQTLGLKLLPQTDVIYGPEATAVIENQPTPQPTGNETGWKDKMNCLEM